MLACTPGCAVKGGIVADPVLEGSHNGLAKPSGRWVWALLPRRGILELVLGLSSLGLVPLAFADWPLGCPALLVAAWGSDRGLFGRTTSSSDSDVLLSGGSYSEPELKVDSALLWGGESSPLLSSLWVRILNASSVVYNFLDMVAV